MAKELTERRRQIEALRGAGPAAPVAGLPKDGVGAEIVGSWFRSRGAVPASRDAAPVDGREPDWAGTPLARAAAGCLEELAALARDGGMVAAIADASGRLLWTASGAVMQRRAERVHFVPGGHWDEPSAGTNALALALQTRRPSTVFSSEHFMSTVADWVCYAAPIRLPGSDDVVGIIDLSSTWDCHTPLGLAAVRGYADRIAAAVPRDAHTLVVRALGGPCVSWAGQPVRLSLRQLEILCLLVLYPEGLDLERLHGELYGDQPVLTATLKAEVSKLREWLPGVVGSRPYRTLVPVDADFVTADVALRAGRVEVALERYRGPLLARSESPGIRMWRDRLEYALAEAVWRSTDTHVLLSLLQRVPHATDACERLLQLLPKDDPRRGFVARVRAAG